MKNEYKEPFYKRYLIQIIVGAVVLLIILFSGNKGLNMYDNLIDRFNATQDSLMENSVYKQDSLNKIIEQGKGNAIYWEDKWKSSEIKNWRLNEKIKKMEISLNVVDTVFISNAKRISRSSDRFYKTNDTIR
jgi:hypothetical protein